MFPVNYRRTTALCQKQQNGSLELGPVLSSRRNVANSAHLQTCLFSAGAHDNHTTPCYTPTKKLPTARLHNETYRLYLPKLPMAPVQVTEHSDQNRLKSNWDVKTVGLRLLEVHMHTCVHTRTYINRRRPTFVL